MVLTHGIPPEFRGGIRLFKPPYAIGSVPSLSGHAIACRWRSLPRVRRHRASSPQGSWSNGCCLCRSPWTNSCASRFPHPLLLSSGHNNSMLKVSLSTRAESGAYSRDSSRFPRRRPFIFLNRLTPSGQSRVYRATQLRNDDVHCGESAGTGPINLKVVGVTCSSFSGITMDQFVWQQRIVRQMEKPTLAARHSYSVCVLLLLLFTLTDRASTILIPSNIQ